MFCKDANCVMCVECLANSTCDTVLHKCKSSFVHMNVYVRSAPTNFNLSSPIRRNNKKKIVIHSKTIFNWCYDWSGYVIEYSVFCYFMFMYGVTQLSNSDNSDNTDFMISKFCNWLRRKSDWLMSLLLIIN